MSESGVRELFLDATSETALGPSMVDVDAVIAREKRSAVRRRVITAGAAIAAGLVLAVAVPVIRADTDRADPGPYGSSAPPPTPGVTATRDERERFAIEALTEHFPGAIRRPADYSHWDGRVTVEAEQPGAARILVFAEALRVLDSPPHPCAGAEIAVCAEYPQPDGSVVAVYHTVESGRSTVVAIHLRIGGTHVQVGAVYLSGPLEQPYSDDVLIRAALDPRFTAMSPGTGE
jgi:hypothetical protein